MSVKPWAKGRKEPTLLVRLDADVHKYAKDIAKKDKMTLKSWISQCIRHTIEKRISNLE